jgi:hypothetical protein
MPRVSRARRPSLGTWSNLNGSTGYAEHSFSVAPYIGQTVTIRFTGEETLGDGYNTSFFEDSNALRVS